MTGRREAINALKKGIIAGEVDAFKRLYSDYFQRLKYYGERICPMLSTASIEDEIQFLFIWLAKNNAKLNGVDNFEAYLFSSIKKNILNRIRKEKSTLRLISKETVSLPKNMVLESSEDDLIKKETQKETSVLVAKLIDQLGNKQREVIFLRFYSGLSYKEIGEIMGLDEQVVRNYAYRSIKKLKEIHAVKEDHKRGVQSKS